MFNQPMNHEGRLLKKETTIGKHRQFALAQHVTRNDASNVQLRVFPAE